MSKIPRVQIKDDLMLTAKPISRLLMIGLTICRAVSCERGEIEATVHIAKVYYIEGYRNYDF